MSSRRDILVALEKAGDFVSGASLASGLDISRAAVWKHISALRRDGYEIESARSRGYCLRAAPTVLTESAIQAACGAARIGRRITVLDVTRSTNSDAMALGREGEAEGAVVIAEEQTAGRGRLGRTWESSRGVNLYASILLRPAIAPGRAPQLSLVAGIAAVETVREEGVDARIKWPNDVVTFASGESQNPGDASSGGGALRKLAGILTEIEAEADRVAFVVVGIGVNLNAEACHFPDELQSKATSVFLENGRRVDRAAFTGRLLARFEECYDAWSRGGFQAIASRWRALSVLEGRRVTVEAPGETFEGLCAGIDDDGVLLVQRAEGAPQRVLAGDVTISGGYDSCQP